MATQHVFRAHVTEAARPEIAEMARYRYILRLFAGKDIEIVIRRPKSKRSLDLNAYWHAADGPFRIFADHFGEDIPGIKLALLGECFGWGHSKAAGREIPLKGHTSELTADEAKFFTDWMLVWGPREHGVTVFPPAQIL